MESDTTTESPPSPEQLLLEAANAHPGWSHHHGGPEGVATLCSQLQTQLARQSEQIAAIRVAAIRELLKTRPGVEVAALLGISKSAVSKTHKAPAWKEPTW